jgi:organic radical activating enzyme
MYLSKILHELERLAFPGQEVLYTGHEENPAVDPHIHLHAEFVRSLNRIEAQMEEEQKVLDAARTEILDVLQSTEDEMTRLAEEAKEISARAAKAELDLIDSFPIRSPKDRENFGKAIDAIQLAARLEISELERKIAAISSEGVAKIEQITADTKKGVSLAAKASQQAITDKVTAKIVKDSSTRNHKCGLFKSGITKVSEDIKKMTGVDESNKKKPGSP